jgi:glycerol-3-phosphate dehydrogenase
VSSRPTDIVEVAVVGGGVVGAAVARLLSHHRLSVVLLEAGADIGAGTSKANTAILHTGFDATPGTAEARLVARGYELLRHYAGRANIAVEETGAVLVAWNDEQAAALPKLAAKAAANGYTRSLLLGPQDVALLEANLGPGACGGLLIPDEHIIDPWSTPLAFAHDALANGATIRLQARVTDVTVGLDSTLLATTAGPIGAHYVVNAAGLNGDELHRRFGFDGFTVRPRRGELIVFDKLARPLLRRTLLPVPTATTKGVLVAPTVFGNVMLGPTAEDLDDKTATGSSRAGIAALLEHGRRILPKLLDEEVTAVYAGLRAATEHGDYYLSHDAESRYVCLGGIRSTGLTASMALAEEAIDRLAECGLKLHPKDADQLVGVHLENIGEAARRPYQHGGRIVCHCERVTEAELVTAVQGPLPATNLDGVRRRTRALAGRCQGFYCTAEVVRVASEGSQTAPAAWMELP